MSSILRTTQNKIYVQGIADAKELKKGFLPTSKNCSATRELIVGSVEAGYFTPTQQELIKQFVDRRGGGLLFLGGRFALSEGGVGKSPRPTCCRPFFRIARIPSAAILPMSS